MDIDKSKENIQPLRGGRNAQQLGHALHALGDADAQRLLQLQRQEHEAVIQNYDGPDPLEPWFHYIQWVEQSFPKHGHEGQIDKLIKQCLTKFENDERYVQDGRFLRLWIKYIDYCSNPLELYQLLYDRGIGTTRSELYRAWACYFEEATDYNRAEQVYNLGLQADAQPKEELEQAHTSFQIWFAQRVLHNDSPTKRKAASALAETRLALTSLRTVKRRNVATVSSQRTGDGIYSRTPGVIRQCVDTRNQARSNVVIDVYDENPGPSSFPASYDAQSGMTASGPAPSLLQSCSMAENQKEVGIWSNSKTEKICTAKKMSVAPLPFTLYEDDLILATNHVPFCREDLSSYQVPLCVPDPPDDTKIPMYNKKEVYKDGESSTKEFSLEEIKARRYKRKFLLHKSKHKSTPDESLHLDTQSGSSSGIRILADCVVGHVSDEANYRTADQFAAGTVLDVQSAKAVELPNEPKIIVNLDSNCQFSEIGTIQIGAEFNLEKVIAQSNSVLNTDDNDACTLELRDNYGIFPSKRSYENDLKTDDIQDENMLALNFNLVQNKCYTNELTKKNVIADFNRSLMADIHEDSMTVNTKEALRELNLFGENDSNPIIATIDAVKFDIREDHSMTMAAIQAKSTNRPNIENYENIGNENLCKETESDTQMDHRGNRIGLRSIQSAQKQIELDETSTQIFTFNVPSASTPYNNHFKKPQYLEPLKRPNMKGSNAFETGNASEKLVQNNSSPKEGSLKTSNNESAISELNPRGNDGLYPIMETTQEYRSGSSASGSSLTTRNTMLGYTARESSGLPLSVINEKHQDINTNQEPNHQHYLDSNAYGKKPAGIQGSSKMNHINVNYNFSNSDNKAHTISPSSPSHSNQQIVSQYHTLDHQYHKIPAGYNRYNSQRNMSQCYQNSNQQTPGIAANNGYQHHISYQNTTTNSNFNNSGFQGPPLHQNPQINYQHAGYHSPQQRVQSPNPHAGFQSPSLIQPGFQSPQQGYASPQHGYTSPQQGFTSPQQAYQNQPNQQIYSNTPIPSVGFQSPTYSNSHQSFQNPSHNYANGQIFQQQHVYMNQNTSIINHTNYQSHETFSNNGQIQHYNPNHSYNNQNVLHQNNIKSSHPVNSYNNYHNNQAHQSLFTIQKNSGVQYAPNESFQSHQEFSNESPAVLFKNSQQSNNSIGSQNTSQNKKSNDTQMDNNISHKHLSSPYHQNNVETQKQLYPSSTSKLRSVRHEVPHVTAKANAASQSLNPGFSNQYLSFISTCNEPKDNANTPKFNNSPNISHKMHKNLYVSSPEQAQIPPGSDINVDIGKEGDLRILSSQNRASLSQHISDKNRDQSKRQLDFESRIDVHSEDSRDSASKESRMSSLHSRQSIRSMQADSFQMDIDSENSMDCHMLTFKSNCSNSLVSTQDIPLPASIDFPKIIDPFNNELCNSLLQYVKFPNKNHYRSYFEVKYVPKLQQGVVATIDQSKYSIEKQLGKGTFGSVFRGFDVNNQEVVALKYQKPGHPWEYYICQEIKARIHDPFMLPGYMDIRAAFLGDNASIFVSELSIYGSLLDVANRIKTATTKCISEFIVMLMTSEMLSIIHYLHKAEIIHADIKPDNFLVMKIPQTESRTPSLQLIDFGCAIDMSLFPDGTNFKKVISTDGFTCTEMRDGRPWTYQTDLFCLAGTVYVILMGSYMQTVNRGASGTWKKSGQGRGCAGSSRLSWPPELAELAGAVGGGGAAPGGAPGQAPDEPPSDWEEAERLPLDFDDSDRFEDDSLCSWSSEPESLWNNWRGWRRPPHPANNRNRVPLASLTELAARCVASHIPFELVEHVYPPVPEQLQLRIAFWSFADDEEDIRLYSCLANGSAEEFHRGEQLFRSAAVKDPLQIGFHLSASVVALQPRDVYDVAVTFDRRRISSCNCTCQSAAYWCSHVVAVCLHRIHMSNSVTLRAPVSESLQRLQRDQLQKFAQYLISELPQQILPTAQRLLDELLSAQPTAINTVCGAPDPTAGASANDQTWWYLDEKTLHESINKMLIKFCVPSPVVFSDVNYLSTTAPPAAAEWTALLRPLRGREPEGMWNLLSIAREMFKRGDRNAVPLLEIITDECIACEKIVVWWYNTKAATVTWGNGPGSGPGGGSRNQGGGGGNSHASQHACSSLCDEIVILWRLAALNPGLAPRERDVFHAQFNHWHLKILEKVIKSRSSHVNVLGHSSAATNRVAGAGLTGAGARANVDVDVFPGLRPAMEACFLDWEDYPIPGVTYGAETSPAFHCPFTCFRHGDNNRDPNVHQVNCSKPVLNNELGLTYRLSAASNHRAHRGRHVSHQSFGMPNSHVHAAQNCGDGNRSSVSSEGFCENDDDMLNDALICVPVLSGNVETDSQEGGGSDSNSSSGGQNMEGITSSDNRSGESSQESSDSVTEHGKFKIPKTRSTFDENINNVGTSSYNAHPHTLPQCSQPDAMSTDCVSERNIARRSSKDESISSSESQQSGDECNSYYFEPKNSATETNAGKAFSEKDRNFYFWGGGSCESEKSSSQTNLKLPSDAWEVLFARAEGLYAHGHNAEARRLGVRLARELLQKPPDLAGNVRESYGNSSARRKGRRHHHASSNPPSHRLSILASATLARCAFLCTVLAETTENSSLAFRVGLFGLEMARPPATTKPLEVKLANQESELMALLRRISPGPEELAITRMRAEQLRDGNLRSRGPALLPIMLATFVFDCLVSPGVVGEERKALFHSNGRLPSDEMLGFEAAVAALGLKANVSEAEHPLLCEGMRRQRGDLALTLLSHYRDDPQKLACIMNKLLDPEVHQLVKSPVPSVYYSANPPVRGSGPYQGCIPDMQEHCGYPMMGQQAPTPPQQDWNIGCASRPQSSTSMELDMGIAMMSMGAQQSQSSAPPVILASQGPGSSCTVPQQQNMPRQKDSHMMRYNKGKRPYPSIPNQPSEASAHFMFELAKSVLLKAGGSSSTSLFTQAAVTSSSGGRNHHLPHRGLHMAAFQLGLYALGLHNCVSANWLSRTYSSHVSWINGQAMDIGAPAISFLIETWEGHLTPPEAASIADRASQGGDHTLVRAAAELALSCLPHAHALNHNEIQRAVLQCKEQSDPMLERACLTVENASKGGGVFPEVLFTVAKYWYELFQRHAPPGEVDRDLDPEPEPAVMQPLTTLAPLPLAPIPPLGMAPYGFAYHPLHIQFHHPPPMPPPPHHMQVYGVPFGTPVQYVVATPVRAASPRGPPRPHQYGPQQLRALLAAYRVGMLALEAQARRVHDDRPQNKYSRTPPYGENVKWLLRVSKKLGTQYVNQFCLCAVNSVVSPFVLYDLTMEAAEYLARNNHAPFLNHLRGPLAPLVQKCQQMYIQCMHQMLYHLTASDYEDFANVVVSARTALHLTPEGTNQFKEWLQCIKRSKSCHKDLWMQISTALQTNGK